MGTSRRWVAEAIARVERDVAVTPLREVGLPREWGVRLHLKDESAQPSGSVKHRLLSAAYADALATGRITEGTTVVMATAGPAAVAGAYFARSIGVEFVAVVPGSTKAEKVAAIEAMGGRCRPHHPPAAIYQEAQRLAADSGGFYLDHFAAAAHVMDWRARDAFPERRGTGTDDRGSGNIGAEVVAQLGRAPEWIVAGAGTGATSGAIGRFLRYRGYKTRLAVADPENSAYFPGWASGAPDYGTGMPSRIEGIGRPRMEPGFLASAIDLVVPVPDAAAVGALAHLRSFAGIRAGGSTGTCLWAAWRLIDRMLVEGRQGDVVAVMGDAGAAPDLDGTAYAEAIARFLATGRLDVP
ncbi:PLP-dependent cysteine synthase family protein [Thermomonospora amylolytica]|uniref:PLP-dependent cysteine synthase family protein n=1 Tax=Thermomonospora amylolytica TaxID=1411117 RepID=UPI000E6D0D87|nr:pyridoxal-phosphate dependent enzyme [Thermomonospora amylolytica]